MSEYSNSSKDYHILSTFWLKIIGMFSMIIDHIGVFYERDYMHIPSYNVDIQIALRGIGRLSFIIFAFLTVEGVLHSRKPLLYLSKLLALSLIVDLSYLIISREYIGNPITTLFIGGLIVYLLNKKEWYYKLLSLLPIAYTLLITFEVIPLRMDYALYGVITIVLFYFSKLISNFVLKIVSSNYGLDENTFMNSPLKKTLDGAVLSILFISYSLIVYFVNPIWNGTPIFSDMMYIQIYSIFALIPIILYNGKRGYDKPWFKYGCYAFYPIHIIIIYLIFTFLV